MPNSRGSRNPQKENNMKKAHYPILATAFAIASTTAHSAYAAGTTPVTHRNDAYVTLSGTVGAITDDDEFTLNYGGGQIEVDTNDAWPNLFNSDANNAARVINKGDHVVVSGKIDNDWFGERELDAYSLRHQRGKEVFNYENSKRITGMPNISKWDFDQKDRISVTGTITQVMNDSRYQMRYGNSGNIEIDTTGITGGKDQHFKVGDRVMVTGKLDDTFFGKREITVDTIQRAEQVSR